MITGRRIASLSAQPVSRWAGTLTVVRFNWPKYVAAAAVLAVAAAASAAGAPELAVTAAWAAAAPGAAWTLTSLIATWWVYDHRRIYQQLAVGLADAGRWAAVHAGFDESTAALRAAIGRQPAAVLEIKLRPGASLRRARRLSLRQAALGSAAGDAPLSELVPAEPLDSIFMTFAAHEVRDLTAQRALFAGLRDALRPGGRLVVTEHLRDLANFAVYGPGAMHFQPLATWHSRAAEAGFLLESDTAVTPFVHRLVWRR